MYKQLRCFNNKYRTVLLLICFLIISLLSDCLLAHTQYMFGAGDMQFHLRRLKELEIFMHHGQLLPKFPFNYFHGSLVMILYPHLNLLPIVLLSLFIKSNITLIYIFFACNIFLSCVVSYYSGTHLSDSKETGLIFSLLYSLSVTFLAYGFYNMDLGVLTSIAILPLVIYGTFNLIFNKKYLPLTIGMVILIFSHVLSTIISIIIICLILLLNIKQIKKSVLFCLVKFCILTMLLTSIIWVPAINMIMSNISNIYPPGLPSLNDINIRVLLLDGFIDKITYNLNFIAILSIFLPILFYKLFYKKFNISTKQLYWISLIIIFICSFFPWKINNYGIFKILRIFQFTWRFYVIPECILSYIFAICITKCINYKYWKRALIFISIGLIIISQLFGQCQLINESISSPSFTKRYVYKHTFSKVERIHHMDLLLTFLHFKYYKSPDYPYYKVGNEKELEKLVNANVDSDTPDYYPIKSLPKLNYINNNCAYYSRNKKIFINHIGYNKFLFNNKTNIRKLNLPFLHYKNEGLRLSLNHKNIPYYYNKNNLLVIKNINKGNHILNVRYVHNISLILLESILLLIGIIWLLKSSIIFYNKKRNIINYFNKSIF